MDIFLRLKHWQLFLLIIGLPIVFQISFVGVLASSEKVGTMDNIFQLLQFAPLIFSISMCAFFGWFWAIAMEFQKKLPESLRLKLTKFKVLFLISMTYLVGILFLLTNFNTIIYYARTYDEHNTYLFLIALVIIIVLHLFSVFGIFYSMYFVAKTIKTVELQREVRFGDFIGEFFMIWFYFIGIWILQPKVNQLAEEL